MKPQAIETLNTRCHPIYELLKLLLRVSVDWCSVQAEALLQLLCPPPASQEFPCTEHTKVRAGFFLGTVPGGANGLTFSCL